MLLKSFYDRLFWIRQESNATSTICSVCIAGGVTSHTFGSAPGEDQYFDRYDLVISEWYLYASQWRCQYESRKESGDERAILM